MRSIMGDREHFKDLSSIAEERMRLDALRRYHGVRIERHLEALKDRQVRGSLLRNAASDLLLSWKPAHALAGILGGGRMTAALGSAIFRRGGLSKRMLVFAARSIVPYLLERTAHLSIDRIIREVMTTVERLRERAAGGRPADVR